MGIKIITVGKVKEKFMRQAIDEYKKRLTRYTRLEIIEVPDEMTKENLTDKEMDLIKNVEGQKILKKISDTSYVLTLEIGGKELNSEELSKKIESLMLYGNSEIVFVIGGSLGLSSEVLKRSNYSLSFSKMTFPHQLMRVILLEQIYRSFKIIKNEPYHK